MRKFFLIPLMALFSCVMAFADNVSNLAELQAAVPATGSAEITLTEDISTDATALTVPEGVTVTLNLNNHSITVEKTLAEFSQDLNSGLDAIVVNKGGTLTVYGDGAITCHFTCTEFDYFDTGRAITSNGTLTLIGDVDITGGITGVLNAAPTSTVNIGTDFTGTVTGAFALPSSCVSGGYWTSNPQTYLVSGYGTEEVDGLFHVIESDVVYVAMNYDTQVSYETLEAAINAAEDGHWIGLLADAPATVVSKEIVIDASGFNYELITAGEGYVYKDEEYFGMEMRSFYTKAHYAGSQLRDFLVQEGDGSYVLTEDADISNISGINVVGNKTLTIPADKKILYQRQWNGANILVSAGAKLTVLGSGTFQPANGTALETSSNSSAQVGNRAIDVSGELVVGAINDDDNCPHFITTSIARGSAITTNNGGVTTINNAHVQAASAAIWNEGTMYINGGTYVSTATYLNGINSGWYNYCIRNQAKMVLKNAKVVGNHGAVSCEGGDGTLEIHGCNLQARNLTGKGGVHYALYVCTKSVVSAYDTKFYSENANNTIFIGDNDSQNSFGLIYLYGGCKTDRKLHVQKKRRQDDDLLFPVLVSEQSEWYKRALIGGKDTEGKLLPANTVYSPIDEQVYDINGDPIDGKKYLFCVVSTAEETKDATGTTIPWQQATTWTDTPIGDDVPEATTAVVIPAGKEVVISNDPSIIGEGANKDTAAVAEQIFLADRAKLTVKTGTTLTVGEGGINVANGGQVVVEPGAIVTVGATGLVTTEEEALVIEATEEDQGVFLLQPDVKENTQPKATVKLVTKCKQKAAGEYVWERFAIPTLDGEETTFSIEGGTTGIITYDGGAFQQGLYGWSDAEQDWVGLSRFKDMKPFKGYQLSNNSRDAGVTYVFEGNLVGNTDQNYQFAQTGFGFFGNSYTGDIDILKFFESFDENMQKTIWIYDYYADGFKAITANNYGTVYYGTRKARHGAITDIRSMQAFLMNTFAEGQSVQNVDYSAAIWGNPKYGLVAAPAPKRVLANNNEDKVTIYVATDKSEDEITFIRSNEYSAEFDNGADASKWMNSDFNLYAVTDNGELAVVASDEIVDMTIAFKSGKETEYTLGFDNLRGEQFELRDVLTGAMIQMVEGAEYTFTQEANTTIPARFQILGAKKVATDIENVEEGANVQQKVVKNGVLYILRDNKWYNAQGQLVK